MSSDELEGSQDLEDFECALREECREWLATYGEKFFAIEIKSYLIRKEKMEARVGQPNPNANIRNPFPKTPQKVVKK